MTHRCWLSGPLGAATAVVGAAVVAAGVADLALPLTGHETLSVHAGRHPIVTAASLLVGGLVLGIHCNFDRIRARARKGNTR